MNTVARKCRELAVEPNRQGELREPVPLEAFRETPAYVLLGDPGLGKSTSFRTECDVLGDKALLITARDFLTFDLASQPEWRGKTLFIDGLDEVRAGQRDARTPFDEIRHRLKKLGKPRFRLSCRLADWLGVNDRSNLEAVAENVKVTVLLLEPLTEEDIVHILEDGGIEDTRNFIAKTGEQGIDALLANPQSLYMLVKAFTHDGSMPNTRFEAFETACTQLVLEHNDEHTSVADTASEEELLAAAAELCAVQLLTGAAGYAMRPNQANSNYLDLRQVFTGDTAIYRHALASKLFTGSSEGRIEPVHRHIAEFLGGRHLAQRNNDGVPVGRIAALMSGGDGGVVTPLRGLSAWLAAHCPRARLEFVERDAIGVGLYGDIHRFSTDEKRALLEALSRQPTTIDSVYEAARAFSPLAVPEMEPVFRKILAGSGRGNDAQALVHFVLKLLVQGSVMPALTGVLMKMVRDDTLKPGINRLALEAFIHHCGNQRDPGPDIATSGHMTPSGHTAPAYPARTLQRRHGGAHGPKDAEGAVGATHASPIFKGVRPPATARDSAAATEAWRHTRASLKTLLDDIDVGVVRDDDNELLGLLLGVLYPQTLPPARVWDHLGKKVAPFIPRIYFDFWLNILFQKSSDEHIEQLLDHLVLRISFLRPVFEQRGLQGLPVKLLAHGLRIHGERIETKRLYDWLGVDLGEYLTPDTSARRDARKVVRDWLAAHPGQQKELLAEGLLHCPESSQFSEFVFDVKKRLYGATPADDFGLWCLEQAIRLADKRPQAAKYLLREAVQAHRRGQGNTGLTETLLRGRVSNSPALTDRLEFLLAPPPTSRVERHEVREPKHERSEQEWVERILANEAALKENRAAPALLYYLAGIYFGNFRPRSGDNGPSRILVALSGDENLTGLVLDAFRDVLHSTDVPAADEILRLYGDNQIHYLCWPFLAGLVETERLGNEDVDQWPERRISKALLFHYCTPPAPAAGQFSLYERLVKTHPATTAEALMMFTSHELHHGREAGQALWPLAFDPAYAEAALLASLRLLRAFPIRCRSDQLNALDHLLWAAIQHAEPAAFQELIDQKLSRKSMNAAQRVHWLAAGTAVFGEKYHGSLQDLVNAGKDRQWVDHLIGFLSPSDRVQFSFEKFEIPTKELFIRLLGARCSPADEGGHEYVTDAWRAASLVNSQMKRLAANPSPDATTALERLAGEAALSNWRGSLRDALERQRLVRRDAEYRHPDFRQVQETLNQGAPANAADLAALTVGMLDELARRIRDGDTSDWRQYWNKGSDNRPLDSEHENECRNALLSDLKLKMDPLGIEALAEVHYADDKRPDIRVSRNNFNVPIEIKKSSSRDLWSALKTQLVARYSRDPGADGYGIYLVFWFGECQPPESGSRPNSAAELQQRLRGALTPGEARKISICVIDVAKPKMAVVKGTTVESPGSGASRQAAP